MLQGSQLSGPEINIVRSETKQEETPLPTITIRKSNNPFKNEATTQTPQEK